MAWSEVDLLLGSDDHRLYAQNNLSFWEGSHLQAVSVPYLT